MRASVRPDKGGRLVTLEHFIVDTFTRIDNDGAETPVDKADQIGGGGTYAIIGARIFAPPRMLGMILDYTPETLSEDIRTQLAAYGADMWAFRRRTDGHPTARAVNRYQGQARGFAYLTTPILLTPTSLLSTRFGEPLPTAIHFISYPTPRAEQIIQEVSHLRSIHQWQPLIVWEPEEEAFEVIRRIATEVDIIGSCRPNHHELARMFNLHVSSEATDEQLRELFSEGCRQMAILRPNIGTVVRCSYLGACYAVTPASSDEEVQVRWVEAYWNPRRAGWHPGRVVDPTGAGNAFMGALAAALDRGKTLHQAVLWASTAASFTIEQDGLPRMTLIDGLELWNGVDPMSRVQQMQSTVIAAP
ncbi:hypothetical protein IAU60_003398 [Kwoniella sp. DSM 27419]